MLDPELVHSFLCVADRHSFSGGFSSKIHLKTECDGQPIGCHLTGGEVSDSMQLETSLDIGPDIRPRAAMTDKGHDSRANRAACRDRGIVPIIPHRSNAKNRPKHFPKLLHKGCARIEQAVGKLKRFKRVALRCEKTAQSYSAFGRLCLLHHLGKIRPNGLAFCRSLSLIPDALTADRPGGWDTAPSAWMRASETGHSSGRLVLVRHRNADPPFTKVPHILE